jgi:hypothetical protein
MRSDRTRKLQVAFKLSESTVTAGAGGRLAGARGREWRLVSRAAATQAPPATRKLQVQVQVPSRESRPATRVGLARAQATHRDGQTPQASESLASGDGEGRHLFSHWHLRHWHASATGSAGGVSSRSFKFN